MLRAVSLVLLLLFSFQSVAQTDTTLLESAIKYYENEQYREALDLLDKYIQEDSTNADVFKMRGNCYYEVNQLENAIADYRSSIAIDSSFSDPFFNLANVFQTIEELDSAEAYFKKYISLEAEDPEGFVRLALLKQQQQQPDSVLPYFNKAYALDSTHDMTVYYLAQEHFFRGNFEMAREVALQGQALDSLQIDFCLYAGLSALYLGDFQASMEQSKKALSLDSLSFEAFVMGLEAQILSITRPDVLYQDEYQDYKFTDYQSAKLTDMLQNDTVPDFDSLSTLLEQGALLPLDDYFRFYVGQGQQSDYSPYGVSSNSKISEFWQKEDFESLAKMSDKVFKTNPLKLDDIYRVATANYVVRDMAQFRKLYGAYFGLIESILASGDGESMTSAYIVMSTTDEYSVLNYLGLRSSMQALQHAEGHSFDILTATTEYEEELKVHFNIDIPFGSLNSSLSGDSNPKKKKKKKKDK